MELVPSTWNPLRAPPCAASAPSRPGRGAGGHGLPLRGWGLGVSVSAVALQRQFRRSRDARAARNAEKAEKKSLGSCTFEVFSMILRKWICKMMLERKQIQPELLTILSVSYRSPSNPSNHSLFDICLLSSLCSHASSTRSKNTNAANSDSWKRNQTNYLSDSFMRELLQTLASPSIQIDPTRGIQIQSKWSTQFKSVKTSLVRSFGLVAVHWISNETTMQRCVSLVSRSSGLVKLLALSNQQRCQIL